MGLGLGPLVPLVWMDVWESPPIPRQKQVEKTACFVHVLFQEKREKLIFFCLFVGLNCDALQVLKGEVLAGATIRDPEEAAGGGVEDEQHKPEEPRLVPRAHPLGGLPTAHTHLCHTTTTVQLIEATTVCHHCFLHVVHVIWNLRQNVPRLTHPCGREASRTH